MDAAEIPKEICFLNDLYHKCLEIGNTYIFYDVLKCNTKNKYKTKKKNLNRDVFNKRKRRSHTALTSLPPFVFFCKFMNSSGFSEYVDGPDSSEPRPTNREVK